MSPLRRCAWLMHWPSSSQGILTRRGVCCIIMANKSPGRQTDLASRTCTRCRAVVSRTGCKAKQNHSDVRWSNHPSKRGGGKDLTANKGKISELIPSPMWFGFSQMHVLGHKERVYIYICILYINIELYTYICIYMFIYIYKYAMCAVQKTMVG